MTLLTCKLRESKTKEVAQTCLCTANILIYYQEALTTVLQFLSFSLEASRHCTNLSAQRNHEETIYPEPKEVKPKAGTEGHAAGSQGEQRNQLGEREEHTLSRGSSTLLPSTVHFLDLKCVGGAEGGDHSS